MVITIIIIQRAIKPFFTIDFMCVVNINIKRYTDKKKRDQGTTIEK